MATENKHFTENDRIFYSDGYDFPLRAGRMMNEGFMAALKKIWNRYS